MDTDVKMNEPMEEQHEPVTAVVPSGVPTTTATQHTPKPPVMSDNMVFRQGPNHRVSDRLHAPLRVTNSTARPRALMSTHLGPSGQLRLDDRPYNPSDNSIVPMTTHERVGVKVTVVQSAQEFMMMTYCIK
ncbi:hypothetical protein PsorP6_013571 [Peronosclerospora sorghi]|uniref:Uncharacterized protein n=1 Tax=Peronosclerospora sorghi TaxID=230839 RepID=A0ACC0VHI8_9STRA|nr:hypothetical protein PsorP6_013571 [Peronosclerospora sorghi]